MRLSRDIARNVLDEVEGEHAIATLVMNEELDEPHERGVNVNVRQWERTFEPQYSAVRLSDTCMKSPYCLKHLAKISKEKSVHER